MHFTACHAEGSDRLTQAAVPLHAGEDTFQLIKLPPDLRAAVLQRLPLPDRVRASSVCTSWRGTVAGLLYSELTVTTAQLTQPSFLIWLGFPGRAQQVRSNQPASTRCVGRSSINIQQAHSE